jgi:DNA-binding transcriptional LysR family regulator
MEMPHLSLLRELADRGSVAAVAEATSRTPSAVSQQLRSAQREIGVQLVERDGRGIRLTEAGRLLADGAVEVETALARVQARLDEFRGQPTGRVRVAALPSAAEFLVPPALEALADEAVTVTVTDVDVAELDFSALTRDHDLVIGHSMSGAVPVGAEHLTRQVLGREPLDVALPSGHRLAAEEVVTPDDVVGERWIGVPVGYPFDTLLQTIEQASGGSAQVVQRVRDNRLVEALVAAGQGVALLPRFTTRDRPDLVLRPLAGIPASRWIVALSRPERAERAVVRRLVAELRRVGSDAARPRGSR